MNNKKTIAFINNAKKIHGNKYDYSLVNYKNCDMKVKIICKEHGVFEQIPYNHLKGANCQRCSGNRQLSTEEFIERSNKVHNYKYDYSLVSYTNAKINVKIICRKHGVFEQKPFNHLNGFGCSICSSCKKPTTEEFIEKAKNIHGNKYNYSLSKYKNSTFEKIKIICNKHGVFEQIPNNHLRGNDCPKCFPKISKSEKQILKFLHTIYKKTTIENSRDIINPYEIDIFLPDENIAIEYCGLYWHSEQAGKDKNYHLNKLKLCQQKGIRLITIFEDEWVNRTDIVKSKLKSILGGDDREKIYARNCNIKEITSKERKDFLEKYHIQGDNNCKTNLGLFYKNKLVAVMSFKQKDMVFDLNRYATAYHVVGGFSKLLEYFKRNYEWNEIFTFADLRWSICGNNIYEKNGFKYVYVTKPNYWYFNSSRKRYSRVKFQKHKLEKLLGTFDNELSEIDNMKNNGYNRIFDCGNIKFIIKNKKQ